MKNIFIYILAFVAFSPNCLAQKDLLSLEYGKHGQQTLDLFLPKHHSEKTPVVILLHGGAWMMGGKEYTDKRAKDLRDRGFVVANIDYRYVSETVHAKELLEDVDDAVALTLELGKKYGYNPKHFHMAGISAGAHLSLLYGYATKRKALSITAICPPTSLGEAARAHLEKTRLTKNVELLADAKLNNTAVKSGKFSRISPVDNISNVPTLLIHGDSDQLVPFWHSETLYALLQKKNIPSKLLTMKGKDHDAGLNDADTEKEAYDAIVDWINSYN